MVALGTSARSGIAGLLEDIIGAQKFDRGIKRDLCLIEERRVGPASSSIQSSESRCDNTLRIPKIRQKNFEHVHRCTDLVVCPGCLNVDG